MLNLRKWQRHCGYCLTCGVPTLWINCSPQIFFHTMRPLKYPDCFELENEIDLNPSINSQEKKDTILFVEKTSDE